MTPEQAYAILVEKWPGRSFCIGSDLWHHDHSDTGDRPVRVEEWSIYLHEPGMPRGTRYAGQSLQEAMNKALGLGPERIVKWADDRSGYEIIGPLTQPSKETP